MIKIHAYLIIAHNQFEILKKLVQAIDDIRNDIYIHIDKKAGSFDETEYYKIVKRSKVVFLERSSVVWGDYSQIACELNLIQSVVDSKIKYEYIHLLSGVDFPIKSQNYIHNFFKEHQGMEFIHIESDRLEVIDVGKPHYYYFLQKFVGQKNRSSSVLAFTQSILIHLQKYIGIYRNRKVQFYKGANWFSITEKCAKEILLRKKWIEKTFRFTKCCDEFFIQTIVMNSVFNKNLYKNDFCNNYISCLRYIDWKRGMPFIFKSSDKDELLNASPDYLFARKFNNEIDALIITLLEDAIK